MSSEPIKLLLVDDTEENLAALEALFQRDGLEILKARSGQQALELLLAHDVALAILDMQMSGMDGFELAELMRGAERTKHVPIVFITAGAHDDRRVFQGYESGAVDVLFKPIEPRVLQSKAEVFFELYRQRQELSHALRLNEMFVGILGHDLRNPLNTIVTGARVLELRHGGEEAVRTVLRIASAADRMTRMIEQLVDLTRARLGGGLGFARRRNVLDVGALVLRAVDELRGAHPERDVALERIGDCSTRGDADRLLQMFSNLIGNAVQHGPRGSAVSVRIQGGENEISVQVQNTGTIPPDLLPTIFDPFRGRDTTSAKSGGLGLGLFISQQIADAHGGSLSVASSEPNGTVFTAQLPKTGVSQNTVQAKHAAERAGMNKRVLVIEDDDDIRALLREAFEDEGYSVTTASDGRKALEMLTRDPAPDIVILDLVLPVLDGNHVYRTMQADPKLAKIPVVVSTSTPSRAPSGAVIVPKPFKIQRLLDAVARLHR